MSKKLKRMVQKCLSYKWLITVISIYGNYNTDLPFSPAKFRLKLLALILITFFSCVPWNNRISFNGSDIDCLFTTYALYRAGFWILSIFVTTQAPSPYLLKCFRIPRYSFEDGCKLTRCTIFSLGWGSHRDGRLTIIKELRTWKF